MELLHWTVVSYESILFCSAVCIVIEDRWTYIIYSTNHYLGNSLPSLDICTSATLWCYVSPGTGETYLGEANSTFDRMMTTFQYYSKTFEDTFFHSESRMFVLKSEASHNMCPTSHLFYLQSPTLSESPFFGSGLNLPSARPKAGCLSTLRVWSTSCGFVSPIPCFPYFVFGRFGMVLYYTVFTNFLTTVGDCLSQKSIESRSQFKSF